ncbi:hypothetical protein J2X65_005138 [Ancylobacter sp. 3268]|nr:hypothetical protein [Ancylobacter sp. 3268]
MAAVPYEIHTVLTDNGIQFADLPRNLEGPTAGGPVIPSAVPAGATASHRLTQPNHPWSEEDQEMVRWTISLTDGQVEGMNRTLNEATGAIATRPIGSFRTTSLRSSMPTTSLNV